MPVQRLRAQLRDRARRHLATRGATLLEVIVVIAIMAMIAGGVGFAVFKKFGDAKVGNTKTAVENIRKVAMGYLTLKAKAECPTVNTLIAEGDLDGATKDPWGNGYTISCEAGDIIVSSNGPDGQAGSDDDIVARKATADGQ